MIAELEERYPFLIEDFPRSMGFADWESLASSPLFYLAANGAESMLRRAFGKRGFTEPITDRRILVISFHIALAVLGSLGDEFLIRRFSVRESKRFSAALQGEGSVVLLTLARRLGLEAARRGDRYAVSVPSYLVHSKYLAEPSWYLVNQVVDSGWVLLDRVRFERVLEVAIMRRLDALSRSYSETGIHGLFPSLVEELTRIKREAEERFRVPLGKVDFDAFPPCIKALLADLRAGKNVPHIGRFALVTFLHAVGLDNESILDLIKSAPDFNERIARYQIEHITGIISGKEYSVPKCATMLAYGLCPKGDPLCERVNHPMQFYRIKRSSASRQRSRPSG